MAKNQEYDRVNNWHHKPLQVKIYKDMVVTFREYFEVLLQLGYTDQSNDTHYRFTPRERESSFTVPKFFYDGTPRTLDQEMRPVDFYLNSETLYLVYEIDDIDDVAKMIEKNREKAQEKLLAEAA